MRSADTSSGAVFAVIAIAYLAGSIGLLSDPVDRATGLLPIVLGVLLLVFAAILLARGRRSTAITSQAPIPAHDTRRSWLVVVLTLLYVLAFHPLGFVASTLAYTFAITFLFKGDQPKYLLAVPPLSTAALYLFFRVALGARMPSGFFG